MNQLTDKEYRKKNYFKNQFPDEEYITTPSPIVQDRQPKVEACQQYSTSCWNILHQKIWQQGSSTWSKLKASSQSSSRSSCELETSIKVQGKQEHENKQVHIEPDEESRLQDQYNYGTGLYRLEQLPICNVAISRDVCDCLADNADSQPMGLSGSFPLTQQSYEDSVEALRALVLQLQEDLKRTKIELQQARTEIALLHERQAQPASTILESQSPSLPSKQGSIQAQSDSPSQNSLSPPPLGIPNTPSENQGFKYLYIPTKARISVGQLRRLNINSSRILDIHYPARNIVAILVHSDYALDLKSHLKQVKITTKDDFDPCNGQNLLDPRYLGNTLEERDS
ncbi:hypothetical protein EDC96DRAFT_579931 [Choanephora cucurbitarum]|nr:hypothetical protein EDC96DRAFT_579931 [Choanephora cucurbitarum]